MAIAFVGGDKKVLNKDYVTAAQNLCDKTLVCWTGSAPAAAAGGVSSSGGSGRPSAGVGPSFVGGRAPGIGSSP